MEFRAQTHHDAKADEIINSELEQKMQLEIADNRRRFNKKI